MLSTWYDSQELRCLSSSTLPSATCHAQDIRLLRGVLHLLPAVRIWFHLYSATTSKLFYFSRSPLENHMVIQTCCFTFPRDICPVFLLLPSSSIIQLFSFRIMSNKSKFFKYHMSFKHWNTLPPLSKNHMSSPNWGKSWNSAGCFFLNNYQTKPSDKISFLNTYFHWREKFCSDKIIYSPSVDLSDKSANAGISHTGSEHSPRTIPGQ